MQETTAPINRDELAEGWAEMGRTPRVVAALKMGAKTDLGRIRENNEDKFDFFEPEDPAVLATKGAFYAVADGMGGHSAGQIACELALKTVIQSYYANPSPDTDASLRHAVEEANALIFDTARIDPRPAGHGHDPDRGHRPRGPAHHGAGRRQPGLPTSHLFLTPYLPIGTAFTTKTSQAAFPYAFLQPALRRLRFPSATRTIAP